jgi:hypothetical protein
MEVYDMTLVRRTSPLGELVSLRQAMDRLFDDSIVRPRTWIATRAVDGSSTNASTTATNGGIVADQTPAGA